MQSSELWAAWFVAAVLVGLVAWVGHIEARDSGHTPASEVARRAPAILTHAPGEDDDDLSSMRRMGPARLPVMQRLEPDSGQPPQVYLCVIDGPQQGAC
jgi:hypothetical protein